MSQASQPKPTDTREQTQDLEAHRTPSHILVTNPVHYSKNADEKEDPKHNHSKELWELRTTEQGGGGCFGKYEETSPHDRLSMEEDSVEHIE